MFEITTFLLTTLLSAASRDCISRKMHPARANAVLNYILNETVEFSVH